MVPQEQAETVLLIEDDLGIAELIRESLGNLGVRVAHVRTTREARAWLEHSRPQLVLLDYSLPDGSGADLVKQVAEMPPFIVTTGAGDERVAVTMMKQGALDYLVKDSSFLETLPLTVQQALHQIATERQLAETQKALQEKETLYRMVIDTALDGFWTVNPETQQIIETNDAYCKLVGYNRAELLQMTIPQLEVFESPAQVEAHQKKIAQQNGDRFETKHRRKDGSEVSLEISVRPLPEIGRNFAFLHDITARKQEEEVLAFLAQCGMAQGEDFFHSLARYLARSLHMDYVCIDRLKGDLHSAQTVAIYFDGQMEDNITYTLEDTPCGTVVGETVCTYPAGVRHLFPKDTILQGIQAESYVGTTLWGYSGQPIGLIAAIGRHPLDNPQPAEMLLKLVSVRAAGEMERKQAEEQIRSALAEKEMLLRELNHRTKNNLTIVSSLIELQADQSDNEAFRALALTLEHRIQSISLVHRMLYQAKNLERINLEDYARELSANLKLGFALSPEKVEIEVEAVPVFVSLNTAIPCGQILNELISNALKYAFPGERCGRVVIQITQAEDGELTLRVSDNGVGLPPDFDLSDLSSLGLTIVNTLVSQIHGKLKIESNEGVTCEIRFRENQRV
jgi:PAS domain S-box-containing protein